MYMMKSKIGVSKYVYGTKIGDNGSVEKNTGESG